jgi:hypothetical protein
MPKETPKFLDLIDEALRFLGLGVLVRRLRFVVSRN